MRCITCDKEILKGDIFTQLKIDIRKLEYEDDDKFLVPDGIVRDCAKYILCENCSNMISSHSMIILIKKYIEKINNS